MVCAFWYRHTLPLLWPLYLTTIVCRIFLWKGKSFLLPIMTQPNYEKHSQHYLFNISYWFMTQKKCTSQTGTWKNRNWCGRLVLISTFYCWVKWRDFAGIQMLQRLNLTLLWSLKTRSSTQSSHHGDFPSNLNGIVCFCLFFLTFTCNLQNLTTHILTFPNKQSNIY